MGDLLRFWFRLEQRVTRGAYMGHGFALMVVKYAVDAALIGLATGTLWTPLDYLSSVPLLLSTRLAGAPPWLAPILALWTLPFLWIGISMTLRRVLDAGGSAWWSMLFFIPVVSYVLMAVLSVAPSRGGVTSGARAEPHGERLPSSLLSMAVGAAVGLALLFIGVLLLNGYGLAVFMGIPFTIGVVTSFLLADRYPATTRETFEVVTMTVLLVAGSAFVIGFEGAVCLLMVAPLGLVVALMGGIVGRELARWGESPARGALALVLLGPGGVLMEGETPPPVLREVVSSVVVEAPPDVVWQHVVSFSPIAEPEELLFRLGLAYPKHAEIDGAGVGAVRYCHFSTGAFVEPITAWEPARRLAFDVVESPRPLDELSPWDLAPPHLEGYLLPRAGEFRLVDLGGRTRLEGSTWYEQRLRPEGYWVLFSDYIISRIHGRVLSHIASEAERAAAG
jgi:uncharacterized membrane protein YhaH (DUF805 family)